MGPRTRGRRDCCSFPPSAFPRYRRSKQDYTVSVRYGDWSHFGTLLSRGRALGTVFYMRDDLSVCTVMISGIPMETDGLWEQLLLPRLEMLSRSAS